MDLRPSIEFILTGGHLLGFGECHFDATFKLLIQQHFVIYAGIFNNGIDANDTFENLLVVLRSHNVGNTLTDSLKRFSRLPNQSFAEFSTILGTRPFTPTGTTKPAFSNSSSSPVGQNQGHKSRSFSSGRNGRLAQGYKSPPRPVLLRHTGVLPGTDMT